MSATPAVKDWRYLWLGSYALVYAGVGLYLLLRHQSEATGIYWLCGTAIEAIWSVILLFTPRRSGPRGSAATGQEWSKPSNTAAGPLSE